MRIAVLTDFFPPKKGGFSTYTYEIAKHWIIAGAEVFIVSTINAGAYDYMPIPPKNIFYVEKKSQGYLHTLKAFGKFLGIIFFKKPNLVFFPNWYQYAILMMISSYFFPKKYPFIIGCHGMDVLALHPKSSLPVKRVFKNLGRKSLRRAKAVFAISEYTAEEIRKIGVPADKIKIFPNGVDNQIFKPLEVDKSALLSKYEIPNSDYKILLTVAQLNKRKGIDTAIRTVATLRNQKYLVNYLIIGNGEDEGRLREIIKECDLNNQVFILKAIENNELIQFYNICDIFILLSRHEEDINVEGFGIALLEANACEKPVVAGNSGGIPDAVEHGRSGYLVDPLDIPQITKTVERLLDDPALRHSIGRYSRDRVIRRFNWKKITSEMLEYMRNIQ